MLLLSFISNFVIPCAGCLCGCLLADRISDWWEARKAKRK